MIQIASRFLLGAGLLAAVAGPARADAPADVQTRIDAAMKSAHSFVIVTSYPAQSYSSTIVYVAPDRSRVAVAIDANTTDIVTVGATSYSSKNGAPFEKGPVTPDEAVRMKAIGSVKVGAIHPDVTIDGVSYGAFETTLPLGSVMTLTCAYDKHSFRLARCSNDDVTQTYAGYDDPKNVVEAPSSFVDAPPSTPAPK
jgi:hypothetical protein